VSQKLSLITVFLAVGLSGVISGVWTHRWTAAASLDVAVSLTQLPLTAGEWDGRELPVVPMELAAARAAAIARRQYVNRRTGQAASALLISGRPGPISVHTPDICFAGAGYEQLGQPTRVSGPDNDGSTFWVLNFQKTGVVGMRLRVYYAWGYGGPFQAADNPRVNFASRPLLFKLYVVCDGDFDGKSTVNDPIPDLLRALVPLLRASLSPVA
jgi:hypothetical protein